jgi:hypothetical protein
MKDAYFFPSYLGGNGEYSLIFKDYPYIKHIPYLKEYYMSCFSYHLGMLIKHIVAKRQNDFVEMALHHSVTIYLMFGSYMFNI